MTDHSVALLRRPRSGAHGAIFCFLGKREGSVKGEACARRRARKKCIKKEKTLWSICLPHRFRVLEQIAAYLPWHSRRSVSKTKRYTKRCDNGGGVEKRGRLCNYLHTQGYGNSCIVKWPFLIVSSKLYCYITLSRPFMRTVDIRTIRNS